MFLLQCRIRKVTVLKVNERENLCLMRPVGSHCHRVDPKP